MLTVCVLQKKVLKKQLAAALGVDRLDEAQKKQLGMVWTAAAAAQRKNEAAREARSKEEDSCNLTSAASMCMQLYEL